MSVITSDGIGRRTFLGYVLAAPTLVVGAQLRQIRGADEAQAAIPSPPEPSDLFDLSDLLTAGRDCRRRTSSRSR